MSKINKHNYEAYLLDYSEGNLSKSEKQELDLFLEAHPELKAELESFEMIEVPLEEKQDPVFKAKLKKEETTELSRLDYLLIASIEDELNDSEEEELTSLMEADPTLIDELYLFQKTKLPKEEIPFDNKTALKQKDGVLIHWQSYAAAVASAAAVIWLFFNVNITEPKYHTKQLNSQTVQSETEAEIIDFKYVLESEVKKEPMEGEKNVRFEKGIQPDQNQFAILAEKKEDRRDSYSSKQERRRQEQEDLQPLESLPLDDFVENVEVLNPEKEELEVKANQLSGLHSKVEEKSARSLPSESKEVSIQEFAKQKLKKEVLKNKTFSEALAEEIATITNDKVSFETQKDKRGETEKFALNIGKFSISRK